MHVCMYVCMYICMYACMHLCMYVCMYVCMHVCMYVCVHECMYVCLIARGVALMCPCAETEVEIGWTFISRLACKHTRSATCTSVSLAPPSSLPLSPLFSRAISWRARYHGERCLHMTSRAGPCSAAEEQCAQGQGGDLIRIVRHLLYLAACFLQAVEHLCQFVRI